MNPPNKLTMLILVLSLKLCSRILQTAQNHLPTDLSGAWYWYYIEGGQVYLGRDVGPLPRWMSEETIAGSKEIIAYMKLHLQVLNCFPLCIIYEPSSYLNSFA